MPLNYSKSIKIRPSVIGYIAKSVALIGGGDKAEGCLVYDFAFGHCHHNGVDLLLLIKVCFLRTIKLWFPAATDFIQAVVLFMAGERDDAILRIDALIATAYLNSTYYEILVRTRHMANITIDIFRRRICIFSLGTRVWRTTTTRVRYNCSSAHEANCATTRAERSR